MNPCKKKSPSNTYVAMCNNSDFTGYYFRKFTMPEGEALVREMGKHEGRSDEKIEETVKIVMAEPSHWLDEGAMGPAWYFLNMLNPTACIEGVMTYEDYINIKDQS
jgi:hypothetical protein